MDSRLGLGLHKAAIQIVVWHQSCFDTFDNSDKSCTVRSEQALVVASCPCCLVPSFVFDMSVVHQGTCR